MNPTLPGPCAHTESIPIIVVILLLNVGANGPLFKTWRPVALPPPAWTAPSEKTLQSNGGARQATTRSGSRVFDECAERSYQSHLFDGSRARIQ